MRSIPIFAFSLAAALTGAVVWAVVGYFLKIEIGWLAWGIGILAGFGARFGAKDVVGIVPGALATIAAILGVGVGKLAVIAAMIANAAPAVQNDTQAIEWVAYSIAQEHAARGEEIAWPPGVDFEKELTRPDFPAAVWTEAEARWNGFTDHNKSRYRAHPVMMNRAWTIALISADVVREWESAGKTIEWPAGAMQSADPAEPGNYPPDVWVEAERRFGALDAPAREAYEDQIADSVETAQASIMGQAFMASLSPWDLLWVGLAAWSAFRIGKGLSGSAPPSPEP